MESELHVPTSRPPPQFSWISLSRNLILSYQSFGVVYGDLSTSPLYVYTSTFNGTLQKHINEETIFGGTFALYTLLCRHAKFNLLPNQQADNEKLPDYDTSPLSDASPQGKKLLDNHRKSREGLLIVVLFGACMVIGDCVLTPAMSGEMPISSRVNIRTASCTENINARIVWNPKIVYAISPHYIFKFFRKTGFDGWNSLGGILLCIAGSEAMFADLGHFTALSIRLAFAVVIYPCLVVQYMGQAAFLSKNLHSIPNSFYNSIPELVFWPVFVIATLATVVGSQAVITATFSIIKQCHAFGFFPSVKVVHTSKHICGQIYIPEANWILMILTLASTIGFQDITLIGNAYGLAFVMVTFVTTFFMALVIVFVWNKSVVLAALFLLFFWAIEGVYLSAVLMKVPQGGWVPLGLSCFFLLVMYTWYYGTVQKHKFDLENKASLRWVLGLGPTLGIVRVPGIGLIYSELATGVPAIFSHFVTNLPAFHKVLVFVCVKSVPVPHVSAKERFLIERVCPRPYRMYRCTVRYGYKDIRSNDGDFETLLVQSIAEFIITEAMKSQLTINDGNSEITCSSGITSQSSSSLESFVTEDVGLDNNSSGGSSSQQSFQSTSEEDQRLKLVGSQLVRFQVPHKYNYVYMDSEVKEELSDLMEAKGCGVTYIMGHTGVKARRSSSWLKKVMIDFGYSFLRRNCRCRDPAVALNIPHVSLIQVGMIYYV